MIEVVNEVARAANVTAEGTNGLREGADLHVDGGVGHAGFLGEVIH